MRILDEEYYKRIYAPGNPIGTILRTPPPDLTELKRISDEFEAWISEEHKLDRERMRKEAEERAAKVAAKTASKMRGV